MKIVALMTDAYGGHGGIAQYNRDVLDVLAAMPEVHRVISLPRLTSDKTDVPEKLVEHAGGRSIASYVWQAVALTYKVRPDLILCGHIHLLPLAAFLKRVFRTRLVIELYGIEAWSPRRSRWLDWCVRQIDVAISISRYTRNRFVRWATVSPSRVIVVPNAIHLDQYVSMGSSDYLKSRYDLHGKRVILTLGRLSAAEAYKGHDRIIRLMPDLLKQQPNMVYVIAGDGDDVPRLRKMADECGVRDQVRFIGSVPPSEMKDLYCAADVFAMPSTGEGFGFVFLEAAACGVPVLGGSVDGSPDALGDGRIGIVVDPNRREALRDAILSSFDQPRIVPSDLAMYDFKYFEQQVRHLILHSVCPGVRKEQSAGS